MQVAGWPLGSGKDVRAEHVLKVRVSSKRLDTVIREVIKCLRSRQVSHTKVPSESASTIIISLWRRGKLKEIEMIIPHILYNSYRKHFIRPRLYPSCGCDALIL